jgi:hypothetical protein
MKVRRCLGNTKLSSHKYHLNSTQRFTHYISLNSQQFHYEKQLVHIFQGNKDYLLDNINPSTCIKMYACTYNPLRLQNVPISFRSSSGFSHQTSKYEPDDLPDIWNPNCGILPQIIIHYLKMQDVVSNWAVLPQIARYCPILQDTKLNFSIKPQISGC